MPFKLWSLVETELFLRFLDFEINAIIAAARWAHGVLDAFCDTKRNARLLLRDNALRHLQLSKLSTKKYLCFNRFFLSRLVRLILDRSPPI